MRVERRRIEGIPAVLLRPDLDGPVPLVFYIHGYFGVKEDGEALGRRLADEGIGTLAFDCWLHGERGDDGSARRRFPAVYPEDSGLDHYLVMHEVAVQAARDIERLTDAVAAEDLGADGRLGVCGFSMGGFAAYYVAATDPRIRCAVAAGGRPAFGRGWADVTLGTATYEQWTEPMAGLEAETAARAAYLASIDPFERLADFAPRPLLMINGDRDVDQPYLYALELYRRLRPLYGGEPERLRLHMPPIAHEFGPNEIDVAARWFGRFL